MSEEPDTNALDRITLDRLIEWSEGLAAAARAREAQACEQNDGAEMGASDYEARMFEQTASALRRLKEPDLLNRSIAAAGRLEGLRAARTAIEHAAAYWMRISHAAETERTKDLHHHAAVALRRLIDDDLEPAIALSDPSGS